MLILWGNDSMNEFRHSSDERGYGADTRIMNERDQGRIETDRCAGLPNGMSCCYNSWMVTGAISKYRVGRQAVGGSAASRCSSRDLWTIKAGVLHLALISATAFVGYYCSRLHRSVQYLCIVHIHPHQPQSSLRFIYIKWMQDRPFIYFLGAMRVSE